MTWGYQPLLGGAAASGSAVTHSGSGSATLPALTASGIAVDLPLNPEARQSLRYRWIETGGVYRKSWHPVVEPVQYRVTEAATAHEGSGTPTLPLATASGSGKKERSGTGTPSLPVVTATGAGKKARAGTGSTSLPVVTATGSGKKERKGTGTPSLPLVTASGSGSSAADEVTGSGTATLPVLTASGAGKKERKGTGADTLPILTASGSAKRALKGSGAVVLPFVTATGSGTKARKGTGATSLPVLTASGAATRALKGSGTSVLPLLSASGDGQLEGSHAGSGDDSLPMLSASGEGVVVSLATEQEQPSGGYGWENLARLSRRKRRELEEEEADRLEALLIEEGTLPANPVVQDRITVREYAPFAQDFSRRTQRAIDYALRARTDLAYQLAAREIARQVEEEELTMLLIIAAA